MMADTRVQLQAHLIRRRFTALLPYQDKDGIWYAPSLSSRSTRYPQRAVREMDGTFHRVCSRESRTTCTHATLTAELAGANPSEGEPVFDRADFEQRHAHILRRGAA